ncbi:rCG61742 [Rattus norvegicus]|uniref:RCG61742 n=1 Tax=Rattus norvegicus TaxID=10116 RepID=A6HAV1_RAT|nr:rCG61742 [Rattus norvegicus]
MCATTWTLCCCGWPGTYYVDQADLKVTKIQLSIGIKG